MTLKLDAAQVSEILDEIAMLMELKGENPFKIRAFSNGSRITQGLSGEFPKLLAEDRLQEIKGIGAGLNEVITSLARTGDHVSLKELRSGFPETLFELFKVQGLGPKKIKTLYEKLDIKSLGELEYACKENRLLKLPGFGEKSQQKILEAVEYVRRNRGRFLYSDIADLAEKTLETLKGWSEVKRAELAGSLRRRKEIVKDVDILCSSSKPEPVMKKFISLPMVDKVLNHGDTKSSFLSKEGVQFDLRVVSDDEYPYALHHFTGSMEHNTAMRSRAKTLGLKMNEYGIYKGEKRLPCKNEDDIFKALGLSFIPPELRENMGEIEAAEKGPLPDLIDLSDIRGVFHMHSTYSDGRNTLEEMLAECARMGLEYVGVSDHSQTATYANGLKEADIDRQHKELDGLAKKFSKLRIFRGIESDILPDGELDYPDRILKRFDFVIGSVHANFSMTEEKMTERCLKAVENPHLTILGHPTGRLLLAREGFKIDLGLIIERAAKHKKIVELNANPLRLDLDWRLLPVARKQGCRISINPDAHETAGLQDIRYGVNIARKGGLTKSDVINTKSTKEMEQFLA